MKMKYLFRGQTRRFGEKIKNFKGEPMDSDWVFGGVFQGEGDFSVIYTYEPIEKRVVYSDTVGMYVWKEDCNGVKIFTDDILDDGYGYRGVVKIDEETSQIVIQTTENEKIGFEEIMDGRFKVKVVGNIHNERQRKEFYERQKR